MPVEITSKTEEFKQRHKAALHAVMPEVAEVFLQFLRQRFLNEGNGQWQPLAEQTQEERIEQGFSPEHPILRRLEVLYGALIRGSAGNVFEHNGASVTVGIGGGGVHPGYRDGAAQLTIEQIALRHQLGIGIPVRRIVVAPDEATLEQMTMKLSDALVAESI